MKLTSLKQLLAAAGLVLGLAGGAALLTVAAVVVVRAGTGADPADAFNPTDLVPESLRGTVTWLDDPADLDREMEPTTRTALEAAWLRAAATHELAPDGPVRATGHQLTVSFYSLDGQIASLSGARLVVREVGGVAVRIRESHDSVLVRTDARWEIARRVVADAIVTTPCSAT